MPNMNKTALRTIAIAAGSMLTGALMTGAAFAYQGHMENALHDLQDARAELQAAEGDKGGHRAAAIDLVNRAIYQTNLGIQYANQHG